MRGLIKEAEGLKTENENLKEKQNPSEEQAETKTAE